MIRRKILCNLVFVFLALVTVNMPLFCDAVMDFTAQIAQQTKELQELRQKKAEAERELAKRQASGASTEQLSQVQLSVQALTKLCETAQKQLETTQSKQHVLSAKPQE